MTICKFCNKEVKNQEEAFVLLHGKHVNGLLEEQKEREGHSPVFMCKDCEKWLRIKYSIEDTGFSSESIMETLGSNDSFQIPFSTITRDDVAAALKLSGETVSKITDDEMKLIAKRMHDAHMNGYWDDLEIIVEETGVLSRITENEGDE